MINRTLREWWDNHHRLGGSVYLVEADWDLVHSPKEYVFNLYQEFRNLDFDQVLRFSEARLTNNRMPDRELMEDASKVAWLTQLVKNDEMCFVPQIVHEPWHDRYRVHPGSGRLAALYNCEYEKFPAVYIHFGDPFVVPDNSTIIENPYEFEKLIIFQKKTFPEYETYPIDNCAKTRAMDSEWDYSCDTEFRFIRWSEGSKFLDHKREWRGYSLDLWEHLNN